MGSAVWCLFSTVTSLGNQCGCWKLPSFWHINHLPAVCKVVTKPFPLCPAACVKLPRHHGLPTRPPALLPVLPTDCVRGHKPHTDFPALITTGTGWCRPLLSGMMESYQSRKCAAKSTEYSSGYSSLVGLTVFLQRVKPQGQTNDAVKSDSHQPKLSIWCWLKVEFKSWSAKIGAQKYNSSFSTGPWNISTDGKMTHLNASVAWELTNIFFLHVFESDFPRGTPLFENTLSAEVRWTQASASLCVDSILMVSILSPVHVRGNSLPQKVPSVGKKARGGEEIAHFFST